MKTIPIHNRSGDQIAIVLVDDADHDDLSKYRWSLTDRGYAVRGIKTKNGTEKVYMHRYLLGLERGDGLQADHINGHKLDNRRENLRVADQFTQATNKPANKGSASKFRGVTFTRNRDGSVAKWRARHRIDNRSIDLGSFATEIEAAQAAAAWRAIHMPDSRPDEILERVLEESRF